MSKPAAACPVSGTCRKACTPPLFGNFGKDAKDLFKKKYEFENQAKFISKASNGGSIETTVVASNDQALRGVFKSTVPVKNLGRMNGTFESEFHTVPDKESKITYKSCLGKGASVKVGLSGLKCKEQCAGGFKEGWASAEVEYGTDYFSGSLGVRTDGQLTLVDGVASVGYDNVSVGGKVTVDTASKSAPNDYNLGVQYNGCDFIASAFTENKRSVLNVSYFQRFASGPQQNFGAVLAIGLTKPSRTLTVGTDYKVDADTSVRAQAKIDSSASSTTLMASVEHRLPNPQCLLAVSADFNVTPQTVNPGRVGVSLTFGDF